MASSTNGRSRRSVRRRRGSSPRLADRPTVPQVRPWIETLYALEGCTIGGPLHSVLDDGNLKDGHLQSVIDTEGRSLYGTWDDDAAFLGVMIATRMLQMTGTQRRKLSQGDYYPWSSTSRA